MTTSVVIPVKDGARFLAEILAALQREAPDEVLVIDSGSSDDTVQIARAGGADVLEIAPSEFGHGRTRNLGVERTRGDIVCFLTQDATPVPGWLQAHREALALDPAVAAAFGPHRARAATSPMIARELAEFFEPFAPDGRPTLQTSLEDGSWHPGFLSNVDASYTRAALEQIRFRDVPYSEDQAFALDLFAAGYKKAYHPGAAVLHAHDYGWAEFMRRYFDEYRGLRETIGHVERIGVRSTVRFVRGEVAADRRWMDERGIGGRQRALWTARSAAHHGGRRMFSAVGSRAERLPDRVQSALSLERRGNPAPSHAAPPAMEHQLPARATELFDEVARFRRDGPVPLLDPLDEVVDGGRLHVAVVIPVFDVGSGGHETLFQMCLGLEQCGHSVSIWIDDPMGVMRSVWPGVARATIRKHFAPLEAAVYKGFDDWFGADVVVATGWHTAFGVMHLERCRARAYVVQDHEPEFYPTSAESAWAAETYRLGLFHIAASPWLKELIEQRYGGRASVFQLGVDHDVYRPIEAIERRRDTVVFYARHITPRRAVPLGLLALAELHRRRPEMRIVLFGDSPPPTTFPFEHLGIASQESLAALYNEATVGLVLSMTNYSRVPQEMLACGLPCVDLAEFSAETVFGHDGPVELADFDADAIADAIERLLDDEQRWQQRSDAGRAFVREHTWDSAAAELEQGLRMALRERADGSAVSNGAPGGRAFRAAPPAAGVTGRAVTRPTAAVIPPTRGIERFDDIARFHRNGAATLLDPTLGMADRDSLHIAVVIPHFSIGSGGHNSIFQMCLGLERRGHNVSIWIHDPAGKMRAVWPAVARATIREHFAPLEAAVYKDFDEWFGADVVVATGWQTVFDVMQLEQCRARAYLVHDHEPEFFATSVEAAWAAETYRLGLFHIAASPWLKELIERRYGGRASVFQFGVDHDVYRPIASIERRRDTVVFYARHVTPRRAVPLGLLALAELHGRRPDVRIVLFGAGAPQTTFPFEHAGVASQESLAALYNEATVGLVLSMTNYSLVPQEMLACGLPCVDLAGFSAETVFGHDGPVELADFDAGAIADAIERLLDDEQRWQQRSGAGRAFVREHTWDSAAAEVEDGLRAALRERERAAVPSSV
jgi:glycosyltransferase involved in cell wall biosynthesis